MTSENFDPVAYNRAAWDREVDQENEWTRPVEPDVIARARAGEWSVVLIGYQPVPRDWFPADLAGTAVLCLASGGGQQGPVLAATGADVTVQVPVQVALLPLDDCRGKTQLKSFRRPAPLIARPCAASQAPEPEPLARAGLRTVRGILTRHRNTAPSIRVPGWASSTAADTRPQLE